MRLSYRIFYFLLPLIFSLAACRGETTPDPIPATGTPRPRPTLSPSPAVSPTASQPPQSQLGVGEADLRGVQISFWHGSSGQQAELLTSWVDQFNAENEFGITVDASRHHPYIEAVDLALQQGQPPDVLLAPVHLAAGWDQISRQVVDLNIYVQDPDFGMSAAEQTDFIAGFWEQDVVAGKRLAIPFYRTGPLLYYNRTWAGELGFDVPPADPAAFERQACAAAAANNSDQIPENDGTGGWIINTEPAGVLSWIAAFGGSIETPGGYHFNTPEALEAFAFLRRLTGAGCAWSLQSGYAQAEFADRRALFYTASIAALQVQKQAFAASAGQDEWELIPFPPVDGRPRAVVSGPGLMLFGSTPVRQLAGWVFIEWLVEAQHLSEWTAISGQFPVRVSSTQALQSFLAENPQWRAVPDLFPEGMSEPAFPSWDIVRWSLSDAASEVLLPGGMVESIPEVLALMDELASEIHAAP